MFHCSKNIIFIVLKICSIVLIVVDTWWAFSSFLLLRTIWSSIFTPPHRAARCLRSGGWNGATTWLITGCHSNCLSCPSFVKTHLFRSLAQPPALFGGSYNICALKSKDIYMHIHTCIHTPAYLHMYIHTCTRVMRTYNT